MAVAAILDFQTSAILGSRKPLCGQYLSANQI